ncbi:glycosyltransferase family 4 protein [Salinimicrobium sediminilitoris]|uniref:glycosyltransferase family 4 protein n=1 Tax=Salinimicrobium sediminilitoris TaxID=2876715 RepID=UPI001E2C1C09|nr:glycosyltransferase family 4 protein [Salinimicrobium sediminilitoris]MCC8358545.1 glycosyltransferase family 4 protein [Salinimicrobium sediminilitoris]
MKKRILYIGNNLSNPTFTATYISFFSEVLKQEGYWVKTASGKDNKALRLMEMLSLIWTNRKQTDVVLIDTYGAQNFYYAYSIGKLCQQLKLPYIPILHGGNLKERLDKTPNLTKSLFGNARINVAPSHFLFDIFVDHGFSNSRIIPNSITLENYPFKERKTFKPKFLWVRRFQERYNPLMAIKVFEQVYKKHPEAKMCMVGPEKDGSLATCKEYAKQKNLPVEFPGKMKKKDWAALSLDYDFFINSTDVDNTPISVIEAMALGLPVISTDVGGMPYLIENDKDGILVPQNDVPAMVSAIEDLLQNPEKSQNIAQAAYEKVRQFDWEIVKEEWISVLNE